MLLDDKDDLILDSLDHKLRLLKLFRQHCGKEVQVVGVNNTSLHRYLGKDPNGRSVFQKIEERIVDLRKIGQNPSAASRSKGLEKY